MGWGVALVKYYHIIIESTQLASWVSLFCYLIFISRIQENDVSVLI